jgi:hypothetical protein
MTQAAWAGQPQPAQVDAARVVWPEIGFRFFWMLSIALLVLNLGRLSGAINTNPLEKALFLMALLFFCIKNPINKSALTCLGLMSLPIYVFGAFSNFADFSWTRVSMAYLALLSVIGFYVVTPSRRDSELVLKSIAILPVLLLVYGGLLYFAFGKPMMMRDHTGAMRLAGATIPAFLAAAGYAASIAAAYLYCNTRKLPYLLLCLTALVVCALSGSRTPSVVAIVSAGVVLYLRFSGVQRLALIVLGTVGLTAFLATFGDQLVMRFMGSSSSGRDLIWGVVEQWIDRYPHSGIGFGHCGSVIPWYVSRLTGTEATHNEYLRLALELGYWGTACFLVSFFFLCVSAIRKFRLEALVVFGMFFLYAYTDNVFFLTYALMGPLACIYGLRLDQEGEPEQAAESHGRQPYAHSKAGLASP